MPKITFDTNIFISRKYVQLPDSFHHDVLIARTAKRAGVTVVTDNTKDFEAIQKFCNVRLMTGDDYFSK